MHVRTIHWAITVALTACAASAPPPQGPDDEKRTPERRELSQEECVTRGGTSVGDIGDGATRRPDYVCPGGSPPLGNIAPPAGGPIAVEGAVCCPR
jgi:hypothetical protein